MAERSPGSCTLVTFDAEFLETVRGWILDERTRELLGTVSPPSDTRHRQWYDELQIDRTREVRLIRSVESGEVVGLIGLMDIDLIYRSAELWLYVGDDGNRGVGIGGDAVSGMLAFAFDTLGLERVHVRVMSFNEAAHQFFAKCGFTHEGTLRSGVFKRGGFHDVHVLSMLRAEFDQAGEGLK